MVVQDQLSGGPERAALAAAFRAYGVRWPAEAALAEAYAAFAVAQPDCLWRTCRPGHFTGSAWIVDRARRHALLVLHRKLGRWLQSGGHADGDADLAAVARREAEEETGLRRFTSAPAEILDLDRHWIPERGSEPGHWHYDVRFLLEADPADPLTVSAESRELAWVALDRVAERNASESLARLVRKTAAAQR